MKSSALDAAALPELDGFRAISILIVIAAHITNIAWIPGGLGVTIFFFISGYIITRLLIQEIEKTQTVSVKNFFIRRFLRLSPALFIYILTCAAYIKIFTGSWRPEEFLSALLYSANYYHAYIGYKGVEYGGPPYGILWSLAVEEHYYLVYPTVFLILKGNKSRILWSLISLAFIANMARWNIATSDLSQSAIANHIYYSTHTRLDSILYGAICALLIYSPHWASASRKLLTNPMVAAVGIALLAISLLIRDEVFRNTIRYTTQGVALMAIVPFSLNHSIWSNWLRWLLRNPVAVYIGKISYPLYLWHWITLCIAERQAPHGLHPLDNFLVFATAIALSAATYHYIEIPVQKIRKRYRHGSTTHHS